MTRYKHSCNFILIRLLVIPRTVVTPINSTVLEGRPFNIDCVSSTSPANSVWTQLGTATLPSNIQTYSNGTLVITAANANNIGSYQCNLTNAAGSNTAIAAIQMICEFKIRYLEFC